MSSNSSRRHPDAGAATRAEELEAFRASITYPPELPIADRRDELVEAIRANQVVIVAGETGSGKSTQLPKMCLEAGRGVGGLIGHTQPRRLAARSIAERISEETGTEPGDYVGFTVRFNDRIGPRTVIRLMTDGILLNELQRDRRLSRYDTIIIDEAHERSLNIDFILGYLRQLLPRRPDLHVIVTSATIDVERFSRHFDDAPIIEVSGRTYPVEIRYRPDDPAGGSAGGDRAGLPLSQPEAIAEAVMHLARHGPGDMLVFLAGERDIREAAEALSELDLPSTEIFPLYARLSAAEQHRVFRPHRGRRIVLATNVAETSVTVPGIRYVIDPGNARISRYNTRTKVQRLPIEDISQASANQRAGRCGRIGPGICVRLYSESDFESRDEFTEPEILRTNLASVILQMAALGLGDISSFPFIEPPDDRGIADGIALLEELDALDPERHGTDEWLTPMGRELARLPVDPRFARMIIEAADHGALAEVLIIVAFLSIQDPRERPTGREVEAAEAHARFHHPTSDFVTLLKLWRHLRKQRDELSGNQFRRACRRQFLNYNRVREWEDTRSQLERTARELGYRTSGNRAKVDVIHQCLLSGLLSHIGMRLEDDGKRRDRGRRRSSRSERSGPVTYRGARGARFRLGRESVLSSQPPAWVMAAELVETNQMWARMAAPIQPRWAEDLGSYLVKRTYSDPVWDPDDGVAYTTERVTLYGLPIVDDRRRTVGGVDPVLGRELFIHHALVEGEWNAEHDFVIHNRELRADVTELETRARRDLVVEQEALHRFFAERLPSDVISAAHFDRWWRDQRSETPELLHLSRSDLLRADGPAVDVEEYPNRWTADGLDLELAYVHDGDSPIDGLSVHIPVEILNQVDARAFEWTVPGLRAPLVTHLLRSLPKSVRRELNPVADTVAAVLPGLAEDAHRRPLTAALADALGPRAGTVIDPDDFDWSRVPGHLLPTFRVLGEDRSLLAEGKDLDALRNLLRDTTRQAIAEITAEQSDLLRTGITRWDFGDLPTLTTTEGPTHSITAYPSLVDRGDSVDIELLTDAREQADAMWEGTRRLLRLGLSKPVRTLDRRFDNATKLAMTASPVQSRAAWYTDTIDAVLDHVISEAGGPSWTAAGYQRLEEAVATGFDDRLVATVDVVAELVVATGTVHGRLEELAPAETLAVSVADARAHVNRLVYPGFVSGIGTARLPDVVRYLEAIGYRLERLPDNRSTDLTRAAECVAVEVRHRELVEQLGMTEELETLIWQLEELRVAQFAQHLRPTGPGTSKVSARRIERALSRAAP